jgi:hypothetical protein
VHTAERIEAFTASQAADIESESPNNKSKKVYKAMSLLKDPLPRLIDAENGEQLDAYEPVFASLTLRPSIANTDPAIGDSANYHEQLTTGLIEVCTHRQQPEQQQQQQ